MTSLTKIMLEFVDIGKEYREADDERVKQGYEDYVQVIIENEVDKKDRNSLYSYWEGLKRG